MTDSIDLEEQARKERIENKLVLHFDMPAGASAGAVEVEARKYLDKYYGDVEYRFSVDVHAMTTTTDEVHAYRVTINARKHIDYGDW